MVESAGPPDIGTHGSSATLDALLNLFQATTISFIYVIPAYSVKSTYAHTYIHTYTETHIGIHINKRIHTCTLGV